MQFLNIFYAEDNDRWWIIINDYGQSSEKHMDEL
jgi:hypothetical protein